MTVTEAIRKRRSIRKFVKDAKISKEQIDLLLEAAMRAPSACNTRPWEFIVVQERAVLDSIRKAHPYTGMLETASLAIIVMALPETQVKDIDRGYYPQDCGAATENILLQALDLGLGTCWCGVYPKEHRINDMQKILDTTGTPFCIIAVGVPDENPDPRGAFEPGKVRYI